VAKLKGNLVQFTPSMQVLVEGGHDFTCSQRWGDTTWVLRCKDGQLRAAVNGGESFTASAGARLVTGLEGKLIEIVGIDSQPQQVTVESKSNQWNLTVGPNQGYRLDRPEPAPFRTAPFDESQMTGK